MKFADSVKQTANLTSTATITPGAAAVGFRTWAQAIADTAGKPEQVAVGDTVCMRVDDLTDPSKWEIADYTIGGTAQAPTLTRGTIRTSSNAGAAVVFGGPVTVLCTVPSSFLTGVSVLDLPLVTTAPASASIELVLTDGTSQRIAAANLQGSSAGSSGSTADTTAPTVPSGLSTSSVTQTAATLSWSASTDNSGVAPTYEVSKDGTSWTAVSGLSYGFSGLTAGTTYTLRVRALDGSANRSAAASIQCTTTASSDTTAPVMSGSITTSNIAATGLMMTYTAGSDNVAVTGYDVSVDTGTANWVPNGTSLSYAATGLTASTAYTLRVRARDAAGNLSNVLTASVTTSAAAGGGTTTTYTPTRYDGGAIPLPASDVTTGTTKSAAGASWVSIDATVGLSKVGYQLFGLAPAPAKIASGWGPSNTTPPALVVSGGTQTGSNVQIDAGYVAIQDPGYGSDAGHSNITPPTWLWLSGAQASHSLYYWLVPCDASGNAIPGAAVCVNPTAPWIITVTA